MTEVSRESILDTGLSWSWLEDRIKDEHSLTEHDAWLKSVTCEPLPGSEGIVTDIYRMCLKWAGVGEKLASLPRSVLFKIPKSTVLEELTDGTGTARFDWIGETHNMECSFYFLHRERDIPGLRVPRVYLSRPVTSPEEKGVIMMEDLSARAVVPAVHVGLNLPQLLETVENLAQLHSWCWNEGPKGWGEWQMPESTDVFHGIVHNLLVTMKEKWPEYFEQIIDPIIEICTMENFRSHHFIRQNLQFDPVLVQGDSWTNNLLFNRQIYPDGSLRAGNRLIAAVDWQFVHAGSPVEDLARLIMTSAAPELRRRKTGAILDFYYDAMYKGLQWNRRAPFSRGKLDELYREMWTPGFTFLVSLTNQALMAMGVEDQPAQAKQLLHRAQALIIDFLEINQY